MHHPTDKIAHTTAFFYNSCGALAEMRNCLLLMNNRSDDSSHHELHLALHTVGVTQTVTVEVNRFH